MTDSQRGIGYVRQVCVCVRTFLQVCILLAFIKLKQNKEQQLSV